MPNQSMMIRFFFLPLLFWGVIVSAQNTNSTLWQGKERQLRYKPEGEEFVIHNGDKRFTRAIYGTNTGFRFETSDFPEFGLFMPGLGGSLYIAVKTPSTTLWIHELESIESRFKSGQRTYLIRDSKLFGQGTLKVDAVALSDGDGLVVKFDPQGIPAGTKILWVFGGASNSRFSREGDLRADPFDSFFIKPENCKGNLYEVRENQFTLYYAHAAKEPPANERYENADTYNKENDPQPKILANAKRIAGTFPIGAILKKADGNEIKSLTNLLSSTETSRPVIVAEYEVSETPFYVALHNPASHAAFEYRHLSKAFDDGVAYRTRIASTITINTPDPFINTLGGIFSGAEDAVWEAPSYLHGAIGWRVPLTGWRAAYLGDLLGQQERARTHFNGYIKSQVTNVPATLPATMDQQLYSARPEKKWGTPMYSNGYICRSPNNPNVMHHYDMNLVFIDELLWHLNWTGDLEYAREIFPAIQRHLAWEKNAFDPDKDGLYDAVCCIWASDALQYNGGKVTHSSAYNYRANKMAAEIALKLGFDATPYAEEANRILNAINKELWIEDKGWWAEFVDNMGKGLRHDNAALWSVYHAIDSDIHDSFKAYQATRYVDTALPHIPVVAANLEDTSNYVIATTNWQPYMWSINNVAFAEVAHTALAYWQTGRSEEAFKIFKGTVLDAMYFGSGPGNITQISFYDAARGETYRDFADPVAMGTRSLVQGMFGIIPDAMNDRLIIRPGFPGDWNFAELKTRNMAYSFKRTGNSDQYSIEPNLMKKNVRLTMEVVAQTNKVKSITVNGQPVTFNSVDDAISQPRVRFDAGKALHYNITIEWEGDPIDQKQIMSTIAKGDQLTLKLPFRAREIFDPQGVLSNAKLDNGGLKGIVLGHEGHRTFFVKTKTGQVTYWLPVNIHVVKPLEIITQPETKTLDFMLVNNGSKTLKGNLFINGRNTGRKVSLHPGERSSFSVGVNVATLGTNRIEVMAGKKAHILHAINWNITNSTSVRYQTVDLTGVFNDKVNSIFEYGKYDGPRYEHTTLAVPTQGMGQWCHPKDLSKIDDSGIRKAAASNNNVFLMPQGIPFATPGAPEEKNIAFTSLWDNYPGLISLPLKGKASKAYLLIAASTYHMQAHVLNGKVRVKYKDGSEDVLDLRLPDNLLPLNQDLFVDGFAFTLPQPRPWRVRLKNGEVSKYHAKDLGISMSNNPLYIDGGMATMVDLPLDLDKELESLTLETVANEVIIGLMGVTLMK